MDFRALLLALLVAAGTSLSYIVINETDAQRAIEKTDVQDSPGSN